MDLTALLLSRVQFAFTITFHIIFPSFTIGLAAWLAVLEALYLATGRPTYRVIFEFWLKIFGVAFGLGVVERPTLLPACVQAPVKHIRPVLAIVGAPPEL